MKQAEGGGFGAATYRSYTYWLTLLAWGGFYTFAVYDLGQKGHGYLRQAFGIQSSIWLWISLFAGWFMATLPNQQVAVLYTRYTGRMAYGDDRIGYAKSGGHDIAIWSGFLSLIVVAFVFAKWVPAGLLSWSRPFALLIATAVLGITIGRFLAKRLFYAQYGPPRYPPP